MSITIKADDESFRRRLDVSLAMLAAPDAPGGGTPPKLPSAIAADDERARRRHLVWLALLLRALVAR